MKSSPNSFSEYEYYITPSDIIEFEYCKRFTYYMKCLGIGQHEEKRYKVQKGKSIHHNKEIQNMQYLRKKLGAVEKQISVALVSRKYQIRGIVDELLTLQNGEIVPLDYKFAKYEDTIYKSHYTQMIMYSVMIEELYNKAVDKAFIVYCRGNNTVKELEIGSKQKENMIQSISKYQKVLQGFFPSATTSKNKCLDCCYKNICVK